MSKKHTYHNYEYESPNLFIDSSIPSETSFAVKEAYKTIRTNVFLSFQDEGCKKIVIASSLPHEGKTTTSINLAIALSMVEKKVLLVDADLRKRKLSNLLKLSKTKGLTDILSDTVSTKDAINIMTYKNLHVLSTGSETATPAEVFASVEFSDLIKELEPLYDYIVFDVPPINVVSDALPIIKNSDGVLFIVRENLSTHKDLKESLASLELINANILGLVYLGNSSSQPYYNRKPYRKYKAYYDGYGD